MYQHAKNKFIPSVHSSDTVNFRVPSQDWLHAFLTMLTPKIFDDFLICVKLCQHGKDQLILFVHNRIEIQSILESTDQFTNQKNFDQPLIFVNNLYKHAKNEAVSSFCSGEMVDSKILQSEWLRAFWSLSQKQDLSQREDLCKNTASNINFHYGTTF